MREQHFSDVFDDFLLALRRLSIGMSGLVARIVLRLVENVERLESAMTASTLACGLPCLRTLTNRGITPLAPMMGLLVAEAERVSKDADAYS